MLNIEIKSLTEWSWWFQSPASGSSLDASQLQVTKGQDLIPSVGSGFFIREAG